MKKLSEVEMAKAVGGDACGVGGTIVNGLMVAAGASAGGWGVVYGIVAGAYLGEMFTVTCRYQFG
ncbi:MAG: hypothetical protein J5808_01645 [Paludibacteraceae bacterium]|nr:hypothetical protein [Paludibacteraceae bacterium]